MYLPVIISELLVVLWGIGLQILQISHFVFTENKVTSHHAVDCRPCQIYGIRRQIKKNVSSSELRQSVHKILPLNLKTSQIQINQPTRCKDFSSLLLEIYVQINMFRVSSLPSSGAQQLR